MKAVIFVLVGLLTQQSLASGAWNPKELGDQSLRAQSCKLRVNHGTFDSSYQEPILAYQPSNLLVMNQVEQGTFVVSYKDLKATVVIAPNLGQDMIDLTDFSRLVLPTFRMEVSDTKGRVLKAVRGYITNANEYIPNVYMASNSAYFENVCIDDSCKQVYSRRLNTQDEVEFLNRKNGTALNLQAECVLHVK